MHNDYDNHRVSLDGGAAIGYHEEGEGEPPLVLLHGLNAHSGSWRKNFAFFGSNMRVLAPSLPSAFSLGESNSIEGYARILEEFLNKLGMHNLFLAGNSMGGWLALQYTLSHVECVRGLVLEDTVGVSTAKPQPGELASEELRKVGVPTLIVWGEEDPILPVAIAHFIKSRIKKSELALIRGAGHVPHWERPDEFNWLVSEFLSDVPR